MEWLVLVLAATLGFSVLRGAPYVPTHRHVVEQALDAMNLQPGDLVVDLGSGDGVFLKAAARRGLRAYGFEINPLLCVVSWLRCLRYRARVRIVWRDFLLSDLPPNTRAVFVFSGGPFMRRLGKKLAQQAKRQPFTLVSYGFAVPEGEGKVVGGLHVYKFPLKS